MSYFVNIAGDATEENEFLAAQAIVAAAKGAGASQLQFMGEFGGYTLDSDFSKGPGPSPSNNTPDATTAPIGSVPDPAPLVAPEVVPAEEPAVSDAVPTGSTNTEPGPEVPFVPSAETSSESTSELPPPSTGSTNTEPGPEVPFVPSAETTSESTSELPPPTKVDEAEPEPGTWYPIGARPDQA